MMHVVIMSLLSLVMSGCTLLMTTNREIALNNHTPRTVSNNNIGICEIFMPLERKPEKTLAEFIAEMENEEDEERMLGMMAQHIQYLHTYIENGRTERTKHYQDYLRKCALD